jgi:hypothetical protein
MRLTETAIAKINNQAMRLKIAQELPCSETWVRELIKSNKNNGPLTTAAVINLIKKETGLGDSEILEDVPAESVAA